MLVNIEKTVVEGAGAAGLAAILAQPERFRGRKVGTTLCGGNIDTHLLANVLVRELVRCGRIARLRIAAQDRPGALAAITAKFHECGVNIIETNHHRIFTPAAGQGHGDRGGMRSARLPGDRNAGQAAGRRRLPRRAGRTRLERLDIYPKSSSLRHSWPH